jgi:hypothetical protein
MARRDRSARNPEAADADTEAQVADAETETETPQAEVEQTSSTEATPTETTTRTVPPERRAAISAKLKEHWSTRPGPMTGRTHSEETRQKIRDSLAATNALKAEGKAPTPDERKAKNMAYRKEYNKLRAARIREEKAAAKALEQQAQLAEVNQELVASGAQ